MMLLENRSSHWRVYAALSLCLATGTAACAGNTQQAHKVARVSVPAQLATAPDQFFDLGELRIRYREAGSGEPVVMLHGRGSSLEAWSWIGDSLATNYHVIALDERGSGHSTKSGDPNLYGRKMAEDVIGILDHLRVRRAHIVGHSQGAVIAAYVGAHYPARVATLSLVAGPFFPDSAATAAVNDPIALDLEQGRGLINFFKARGLPDSTAVAANAAMMAENDAPSLAAMARALGGLIIPRTSAPTIRMPALVVVGTSDDLLPYNRQLAAWWPGAHLVEVSGANHISILRRPELLSALRTELLKARAK